MNTMHLPLPLLWAFLRLRFENAASRSHSATGAILVCPLYHLSMRMQALWGKAIDCKITRKNSSFPTISVCYESREDHAGPRIHKASKPRMFIYYLFIYLFQKIQVFPLVFGGPGASSDVLLWARCAVTPGHRVRMAATNSRPVKWMLAALDSLLTRLHDLLQPNSSYSSPDQNWVCISPPS